MRGALADTWKLAVATMGLMVVLNAQLECAAEPVIYSGSVGVGVDAQKVEVEDGVVKLTTPEAVSATDRYRLPQPHDTLIAYSLKAAWSTISKDPTFRAGRANPELWQVGGINSILGAIIDPATEDVIIVGHQDLDLPPLTLDELVTILRATFVVHKAPFISIDPPQEKPLFDNNTTEIETIGPVHKDATIPLFQQIRTDGGVVDTQVGANMIDADFRMKLMMFGLLPSGVGDVDSAASELSLTSSVLLQQDSRDRFEFYPDANGIYVDRLFVVLAGGGLLGVRTEREGGAPELASAQRNFASALSAHTRDLSLHHPTIGSIYVYSQLQALAVGLQEAKAAPYIEALVDLYHPTAVSTVKRIPEITIARSLLSAAKRGLIVRSFAWLTQNPAGETSFYFKGGVTLGGYSVTSTLRQGGLTLRSAIINSRPDASSVSWTYQSANSDEGRAINIGNLISISDSSAELQRLRRAEAAGLVETVFGLAKRILQTTNQDAAIREAIDTVALTAILANREEDGATLLLGYARQSGTNSRIQGVVGLLNAVWHGQMDGPDSVNKVPMPNPDDGSRLIWALALKKVGQSQKACSIIPDLHEGFVNELTLDLALECADARSDSAALARYLALGDQFGLRTVVSNFYRAEIDRLSGRQNSAAAWYYSYLGEEPSAEESKVKIAREFLGIGAEANNLRGFEPPTGYGVAVLLRAGQWQGSANGRLVTSQSGAEIYGRLGPGEFLVVVLQPGPHILRLLGSVAIGLNKEFSVDIKAGQVSAFNIETMGTSVASRLGTQSGIDAALSCAQGGLNDSRTQSGGYVLGLAVACTGAGAIAGVVNWASEKSKERHDDFLIGAALDAKPIAGTEWRTLMKSMNPASPWGDARL